MYPSAPSDNQQLAADSSSNHPHPDYQCPTHLAKKVFLERQLLRGFWVLWAYLLLFFPLIFSFKYELNFSSLSPVKCGNFQCSCTVPSSVPQFFQASFWTLSHLTEFKVKVFAIIFCSEFPKTKKISHSGETGGTLGTSRSPIVTGFVSMKICICFVCKMKHNLIYPMTS